jgi:hypothetical protein
MVKRFHGTDVWEQDWFLAMEWQYRMFWLALKDHCNHAGVWKPNKKNLEFKIGAPLDLSQAEKLFNVGKKRVRILKNGRWFLEDFITFQYGKYLNPKNRVHFSILNELLANGIDLASIRGQREVNERSTRPQREVKQGVKDKDKDKSLTPIQSIVLAYRIKKYPEITEPEAVKEWNKDNFPRCAKHGLIALKILKDWRTVVVCIDQLGTKFDSLGMTSWTLMAIANNASDWKLRRQKEQNDG